MCIHCMMRSNERRPTDKHVLACHWRLRTRATGTRVETCHHIAVLPDIHFLYVPKKQVLD